MSMKHIIGRAIGERRLGGLTYRCSPERGRAWGGPMNGQAQRCLLAAELIARTSPVAIVETGTYRGTTTEWLAAFQLPIYSCEASLENFGFSSARLGAIPNVHLNHTDSRTALRNFLSGPLSDQLGRPILFYLDAHWADDLPLGDEIEIIFSSCKNAIVLVDDFEVSDDPGYCFDDYGPGKKLHWRYIASSVEKHGLAAYYPRKSSHEETGAKRGCIVLAVASQMGPALDAVTFLRRRPA